MIEGNERQWERVKVFSKHDGSSSIHPRRKNRALDVGMILLLTMLAFVTRFYRLSEPPAVVFDEYHFGKFTNWVMNRTHYFDIHPPLGKLTFAGLGYLMGYEPVEGFMYDAIGKNYTESGTKYYRLRVIAASFGVATVPMVYETCRTMRLSVVSALLPSAAMLLDFLNLIESRLILMDSQLLFWCVLALLCALKLWNCTGTISSFQASLESGKFSREDTMHRFQWLVATGLVAGAALSIKWTALATPGLIALVSFLGIPPSEKPLPLSECLLAGFLGIGLYTLIFKLHFMICSKSGPGDAWMPLSFQATLKNSAHYNPEAKRPWFVQMFAHLNWRMLESNARINVRHHWESHWYQWVVNWRGLLMFSDRDRPDKQEVQVYLIGNPFVVYTCFAFSVIFAITVLVLVRYRKQLLRGFSNQDRKYNLYMGILLLVGWLLNLLPYILVDRPAFVYHYIPGLYYAMLLSGICVEFLPPKVRVVVVVLAIIPMVWGLIYWAPWIYALPIPADQHAARRWLKRWD